MSVISRGVALAQQAFNDIEKKISIWVSNDPTLEVDSDTFSPELILTYVPRWPLLVHLGSACFCFGSSTIFHQFQIHSPSVRSILHRLDLGGICFLIMGSAYPVIMYPFACKPTHKVRDSCLGILTCTCFFTFVLIMMPKMNQPKYKPLRGALFVLLGISDMFPFIYLKYIA